MKNLYSEEDIIGYRPNLEYIKEENNITNAGVLTDSGSSAVKKNYSNSIKGLKNALPHDTIKDINYITENIKTLIHELAQNFENGNWSEYNNISSLLTAVESNNKKQIEEFIEYHRKNIKGSIIPELIGHLYDSKTRMELLNKVLKEIYFGNKNIEDKNIESKGNSYYEKIKQYENTENEHKINYLSMSKDATFNRIISSASYAVNKSCIDMSEIINNYIPFTNDKEKNTILEKLFNEAEEKIEKRKNTYKLQSPVEIIEKTLYNYYQKKSDFMSLYEMFDGEPTFTLMESIYEHEFNLDKSMENVIKAIMGNANHNNELIKLEEQKHKIKENYKELNFK